MERSVYTPGAGKLPIVLAGRDALLHQLSVVLNDAAAEGRRRVDDVIVVGPRGVGKTVALTVYGEMAAARGFEVVNLQAVAGHAGIVDSLIGWAADRIAANVTPWSRAKEFFDRIASVSLGVAGVSASIGTQPQPPDVRALDPGTLARALSALAAEVRKERPVGGVLITVDEMQVAAKEDLALLAAALHRLNVDHRQSAVVFAGTGLPHTPQALREAGVTHPDRLFLVEEIPITLSHGEAEFAIVEPARQAGCTWHPDATAAIIEASNGYPAHLQLYADATWRQASGPIVGLDDALPAIETARSEIARRTLGPRWDYMSDRQREFMAAVALQGQTVSTSAIAGALGRSTKELSGVREDLIREGDIYSSRHGYVTLTMPTFAVYIVERYEDARAHAAVSMLSLEEMNQNITASPRPPLPRPPQSPAQSPPTTRQRYGR